MARDAARRRGTTLGHLVEDGLRRELAAEGDEHPPPPLPNPVGGPGPRLGVDLASTRAMLEVLDEDVDLDRLR